LKSVRALNMRSVNGTMREVSRYFRWKAILGMLHKSRVFTVVKLYTFRYGPFIRRDWLEVCLMTLPVTVRVLLNDGDHWIAKGV
jgi:hypothetical protein